MFWRTALHQDTHTKNIQQISITINKIIIMHYDILITSKVIICLTNSFKLKNKGAGQASINRVN